MSIGVLRTLDIPVQTVCPHCKEVSLQMVAIFPEDGQPKFYSAVANSTRWHTCPKCRGEWVSIAEAPHDRAYRERREKLAAEINNAIPGPPPVWDAPQELEWGG
jgi:hypothetical protein